MASAPAASGWRRLGKRQQLAVIFGGSLAAAWAVDAMALRPLRSRLHSLHEGPVYLANEDLLDPN